MTGTSCCEVERRGDGRAATQPTRSPGSRSGGRIAARHADPLGQVDGPLAAGDVVELGGGGVGALGADRPGQPVAEQVGHQQQRLGGLEGRRAAGGDELVDGVERQLLQAGGGVQLLRRHQREHLVEHAVGAPVAVAVGVAEQPAVAVEQAVVDRPGVDPDAVERAAAGHGARRPVSTSRWMPDDVPEQASPHRHAAVGEAVHLGEVESRRRRRCPRVAAITRPLVAPRSTAATRRPHRRHRHRRKAAATPASTGTCSRWCGSCRGRRARRPRWRCARGAPRA